MTSSQRRRPLSPHLQIYNIQITSFLSVLHRGTGIVLFGGAFVWACYFLALVSGPSVYETGQLILLHPLGLLLLSFWIFSLCYHVFNGIRHLVWDLGYGYDMKTVRLTGWITITSALALTTTLLGFILLKVYEHV